MADDPTELPGEAKPAPGRAAAGEAERGKAANRPNGQGGDVHGAAAPGAPAANGGDGASAVSIDLIRNIPVTLSVVLGSVSLPVSSLMKMQRGEIISLSRRVGEPVEVLANGKLIARGEIVVLEEEEPVFAISLTELVGSMAPGAVNGG
ncbi:MAG: hypothetical protein BroJett030_01550 [Alphaproteobacteria bacterium]|nr:MAG: hypothetical protein BroJett030_01550 [Alphaproteobacteria bacterium]